MINEVIKWRCYPVIHEEDSDYYYEVYTMNNKQSVEGLPVTL